MYGCKALNFCSIPFTSKFFFHKYLIIKLFIYIVFLLFMNGKLIGDVTDELAKYRKNLKMQFINRFTNSPNENYGFSC